MDVGFTAMLQEALERSQAELAQAAAEIEQLRAELQACRAIQQSKNDQIHRLIQQVHEVARAADKSRVSNERRCAYCLSKPAQPDGSWCAECEAELEQRDAEQGA